VILGKALGGGILPVSAFLSTKEILKCMLPGSHGSTFGGNPLAATVALKALEIIERDHYVARSHELGAYLMAELRHLNSPLVLDIRGSGLWIALEIDPKLATARQVCEAMMARGVLSKETHGTVVRLAPPLIITKEELDFAVKVLEASLAEIQGR
jgi:ornithine--oxo-acid transaminase